MTAHDSSSQTPAPRPPLRVCCAWCESAPQLHEPPISHGICRECARKFFGIDPEQVRAA